MQWIMPVSENVKYNRPKSQSWNGHSRSYRSYRPRIPYKLTMNDLREIPNVERDFTEVSQEAKPIPKYYT